MTRAGAIVTAALGAEHPLWAHVAYGLGQAELARGHAADAVTWLERAVARRAGPDQDPNEQAEAAYALAQALVAAGRDRARARALAAPAIATWTAAGAEFAGERDAAAVVLFEMLTGHHPWSREQLLAGARTATDFRLPAEVTATVPTAVAAALAAHLDQLGRQRVEHAPAIVGRRRREAAGQRPPGVAAGQRHQLVEGVVRDPDVERAQAAVGVGQRPAHDRRDHLVGQGLEPHHPAPRQERADHPERRVLGGGPDQGHGPGLDVRQERVLLGLREPVDLVDEQHGPPPVLIAAGGGLGHRLADVLDPGVDRRQGHQVCADRLGDQARQGGLSGPRWAPQQERRDVPPRRRRSLPQQQPVLVDAVEGGHAWT